MRPVDRVIAEAERLLARPPASDGHIDLRWKALIDVADFVRSDPDDVWRFVLRWGTADDDDVRAAIATCLLEHLLEHHFDRTFPLVEDAVSNPRFADTFCLCWKFGQSDRPPNAGRFDRLRKELAERRARGGVRGGVQSA